MSSGSPESVVREQSRGTGPRERRILFHGPSRARFDALVSAMATTDGVELSRHLGLPILAHEGDRYRFVPAEEVSAARSVLASSYVSLLVVDLASEEVGTHEQCNRTMRFLRSLDDADDIELRHRFHRTLVLLPDHEGDHALDELVLALGRLGIRHVHRIPAPDAGGSFASAVGVGVFRRLAAFVHERDLGSMALVANGGGITGIYFELGALKCLDDCLGPNGVDEFDSYYGISAGAVVTSLMAVGYSIDEQMAAVAGHPGGRMPALSLSLLRFGHVNVRDHLWRWRRFATSGLRAAGRVLQGRARGAADDLFLEWTSLVGAPFHSDGFESMVRRLLEAPGATNRFSDLERPLYIGASDQDARRPVLFGDPGYDRMPISRAVQASLAINPAFTGVRIGDRFYEDGAITRTSSFVEAIERGSRLVFVLDPFVPYVSKKAGANNRRGMLYNVDQDIRTMSFTRFETTRDLVLRDHPDVSSYTFLPANSQRKLLSANPMDHRPFLLIWRAAYLSTLARLEQVEHRLAGDLALRGRSIDLSRARLVAAQLRRSTQVGFADFFPERQIALRQRPLLRERVRTDASSSLPAEAELV